MMPVGMIMRSPLISHAFLCFCICLFGNIFFKLESLIFRPMRMNAIPLEQHNLVEMVPNLALFVVCGIIPILCFAVDSDALTRCCMLFLAIGLTGFVTDFLKLHCPKRRPNYAQMVEFDEQNANMSFPSGHSSLAFTAMLLLSLFLKEKFRNAPYCLTFSPMLVALLVAWSQVHDGWHFNVDVCAGAVIGIASVIITYQIWYVIKCDVC